MTRFETTVPLQDVSRARTSLPDRLSDLRYAVRREPSGALIARRGSRFSPTDDGIRHEARFSFQDGAVRIELAVQGALPETAGRAGPGILAALESLLKGSPVSHPSIPSLPSAGAGRSGSVGTFLTFLACLAPSFLCFLFIGWRLITLAIARIRAGGLAWEYYPAAENLSHIPWSTPWIAAGFLAATAGLAVGLALSLLFLTARRWPALAESFGNALSWCSLFLVAALVFHPNGIARILAPSMLVPTCLAAAACLPWAAFFALRLLARPGLPPARALAALLPVLACCAAATPDPRDRLAANIRAQYDLHHFRDLWLAGNPAGEFFNRLYYRYTPYADLITSEELFPDRRSLRLLRDAGTALWFLAPAAAAFALIAGLSRRALPRAVAAGIACAVALVVYLLAGGGSPPDARDAPGLARQLGSGSTRGRIGAAHALTSIAGAGEMGALAAGLADPDPRVRLWCATGLARAGDWAHLPGILARLRDPHFLVRSRAADALRCYGERAAGSWGLDPAQTRQCAPEVLRFLEAAASHEGFVYVKQRMLRAHAAWAPFG